MNKMLLQYTFKQNPEEMDKHDKKKQKKLYHTLFYRQSALPRKPT